MTVDTRPIDEAETDLLDRLGFLLARHGAVADNRIRHALEGCRLTPRQGTTLILLGKSGSMGQQALAAALDVDASVMVGILNELESAGLVERRRDRSDRRRHIVAITDEGNCLLAKTHQAVTEVEQELFGRLSPEEIATLRRLLLRIETPPDEPSCTE
ncbi:MULTISPECIES: MarR family winged helix-turn-helix transcriptional regulator [Streptomyces]|uniref:MarR family winged helix-turn-helix transcriptional regulator n=1 Tax=Streptomyces TaxID=1883 RepID=UPI001F0D4BFC|nr:MarR family winged helix-turn-helix transcriptional regulator [Streptomyces sp. Z423-1]